jgi:putative acetyltransferase
MQAQEDISAVRPVEMPRVVEVWEASVRATHTFLSEYDIQFFKTLVPDALAQLDTLLCMRDDAGQVIGFIGVEDADVATLFIHPDWRGHGVGRRLMEYATNSLGANTVDVNEQNEQAIGFYTRMGFEVIGRSPQDGFGKPFPLLHMRLRESQPG